MTKEEYRKLLLDPRWISLSNKIKRRDNYTCKDCQAKNCVLQVHHEYYIENSNGPWDIPTDFLVTLCVECHKIRHLLKPLHEFYISRNSKLLKNYPKFYNKKKIKKEKKQLTPDQKRSKLADKIRAQGGSITWKR